MADPSVPTNELQIKIGDEELKGRYANLVRVTHSREEFILDFIHLVPPSGIVTARIVSSPWHTKRLAQALAANLARYEEAYGPIEMTPGPEGFRSAN